MGCPGSHRARLLGACSAPAAFPTGPPRPPGPGEPRRGAHSPAWASPASPSTRSPGTQVPFSRGGGGRKLTACLPEQLGLVASAGRAPGRLDNPGCVLGNQGPKEAAGLWPKSWRREEGDEAGGGASAFSHRPAADWACALGGSPPGSGRGAEWRLQGSACRSSLTCLLSPGAVSCGSPPL